MIDRDGNPWFVAADVCSVLGLAEGQTHNHLRVLDADEVEYIAKSTLTQGTVSFPNRGAKVVSESGLYKLVLRSDKPQAKPFQDWVTKVVLPAIRKDGAYVAGEEKLASGEMSEDEFIHAAVQFSTTSCGPMG